MDLNSHTLLQSRVYNRLEFNGLDSRTPVPITARERDGTDDWTLAVRLSSSCMACRSVVSILEGVMTERGGKERVRCHMHEVRTGRVLEKSCGV